MASKQAMNKILIVMAVVLALALLQGCAQESKVIKIGVIAPLTGPAATFGNSLVKGIELAQADLGAEKSKFVLVIEDDQSKPANSATAAQKLIEVDQVDAIITTTSGTGNAVRPLAEAAKVLHICVCSDPKVANGTFQFTHLVLSEDEAHAWVAEAKKQGIAKVAIVSQIHPGINAIVDAVKKELVVEGLSLVAEERFAPETTDFQTIFLKAQQGNPDIFLVIAFPPSIDLIGQAHNELGIKQPISGVATFALSAKPELFEGDWFIDAALVDPEFAQRFAVQFPGVKFNARTAPFGFDAFNMLVDAFESEVPVDYLNQLDAYTGKVGTSAKTSEGRFRSIPGIWKVEQGKIAFIRQSELAS